MGPYERPPQSDADDVDSGYAGSPARTASEPGFFPCLQLESFNVQTSDLFIRHTLIYNVNRSHYNIKNRPTFFKMAKGKSANPADAFRESSLCMTSTHV